MQPPVYPDKEPSPEAVITAEMQAHRLLDMCYRQPPADIFNADDNPDMLDTAKRGADLLVDARLAAFADEGRTQIMPTGAGRYWALHGGYLAFLKEEPAGRGGGGRNRNPELEALRLELTRRRLGTFWWSFGLSLAGFIISIISLTIALIYGHSIFR